MSIFGSREDDPLLQDDPFAPPPDDDPSAEEDASPAEQSADAPSDETPSRSESVFGPSDGEGDRFSESTSTRVLVHPVEEAANGHLAQLNMALDEGWRFRRVELREEATDEELQSRQAPRTLAFVLHRSGDR